MKAILTFLTLALFASPLLAKKIPGLKVMGNYKELWVVVEKVDNNTLGLTEEDVNRAVKLRLLANGIKDTKANINHFLHVVVDVMEDGSAFKIDMSLVKFARSYGVNPLITGDVFEPNQRSYGTFGTSGRRKQFILDSLNSRLDAFLLDYLESNIE